MPAPIGMEQVLDAIRDELDSLAGLDYDEGGIRDQIELAEDVWWGNPGILAITQYPYLYIEPVLSVPQGETTGRMTRTLTVRVVLLIDPRSLYDVDEVVEQTASREMVRAMTAIEAHFEKTSLRIPDGLAVNTQKVTVATTEYAQQVRGELYSLGASIVLSVDQRRPRAQ